MQSEWKKQVSWTSKYSLVYLFASFLTFIKSITKKIEFTIVGKLTSLTELEYKRIVVVCTTAEMATYLSNELYAKHKVENLLNQSKIQTINPIC